MSAERYNVVFSGEIAPGRQVNEVKTRLARIFKLPATQIDQMFSGQPMTIKTNIDHQTALKYQATFQRAGAICSIHAIAAPSPSRPTPPRIRQTIVCPKCGFEQEETDECVRCGIIISRYSSGQSDSPSENLQDGEMLCPKCGFKQREATRCQKCGVFVKNYIKMQERQAQHEEYADEDEDYYTSYESQEEPQRSSAFGAVFGIAARILVVALIAGAIGYCTTREKVVKSPNGDFQLTKPRGWEIDNDLNDEADIQIANAAKEGYFIVLSDMRIDFERGFGYQEHAALTLSFIQEGLVNYKQDSGPVSVEINGMNGIQYEISGSVDGIKIKYLHTTLEGDTYFHQLIGWSLFSQYDANRPTFDRILNSFHEL